MAAFYRKDEIPEHLQQYFCPAEIGLEATPDAYVQQLVAVFREVRRVLKDDGIVWLNLGDSYSGSTMTGGNRGINASGGADGFKQARQFKREHAIADAKPKDLLGIPWRVAFALQADGWYLRSDVIWHKPNPMPESVTDRPTKAHEYLFLLTKSERYFYDADAVREADNKPQGWEHIPRSKGFNTGDRLDGGVAQTGNAQTSAGVHRQKGGVYHPLGRNRRSVWTVPTMPYSGAHFATMPEKLVEPCILAGSRLGDRVLDPFMGSGTVGAVAERLGRRWVGLDLNPAYHKLAKKRTAQRGIPFSLEVA